MTASNGAELTPPSGLAGLGATPDESEILAALADSIDRYASAEIDTARIDLEHTIPRRILEDLAEMGLFGLSIPEEYGGYGLSMQGVCSTVARLARHDRSVAVTVGLHLGLGLRGLVAFGSEELKSAYLPDLAEGKRLAAFATTEAGAGSDLMAIRTRAVPEGDLLCVDGEKIYVTNGGLADVITITAATPGLGGARRGHSLVLLRADDQGLTRGAEEDKLGIRGSSTTTLHFEELRIPTTRVIGEPGKGMKHLQHVLAWGRTAMAGGCTGTSWAALERTLEQVVTREQFGSRLGDMPVIREQVAGMAARIFAMEALVRHTNAVEHEDLLLVQRSNSAKVFCSDESWWVCDMAIQLHGGSGFVEETGVALPLRDGRITRIFEGANDVLLVHAGQMEATLPPKVEPLQAQVSSALVALAERADRLRAATWAVRKSISKSLGIRVLRRPRVLHRLGQLAVLRDATEATVLRADAEGTEHATHLATHWLDIAEDRLAPLLREQADVASIDAITEHLYAGSGS